MRISTVTVDVIGKKYNVPDSFAGSGTVLIAAERLGRKAFLVELDPRFCDVAIKRWEQLWHNTSYSFGNLTQRLPFVDKETEQKLQALIATRVLYPDGTVNCYVERLLRAQIVKMLSRSQSTSCQTE